MHGSSCYGPTRGSLRRSDDSAVIGDLIAQAAAVQE